MDVDTQDVAGHLHDHVEVELEFVRDALFDAELVALGAFEPCAEFGEGEDGADGEDKEGPLASATGGSCIGGFCFCWSCKSVS